MKLKLALLMALAFFVFMISGKSVLERDAEALATVIAERTLCNVTPIYRGFDGVAGMYDFEKGRQEKFRQEYEKYLAKKQSTFANLTEAQQTELCLGVDRSMTSDIRERMD